jgi:hypothetical protein
MCLLVNSRDNLLNEDSNDSLFQSQVSGWRFPDGPQVFSEAKQFGLVHYGLRRRLLPCLLQLILELSRGTKRHSSELPPPRLSWETHHS